MDGISIAGLDTLRALEATTSGGTLGSIFTGVAETALATAFAEAPDSTTGWVTERQVRNFKTNERPHVEAQQGMEPLPRGKEPKHIALVTSSAEQYRVQRFANKFEIDDQDIISGDVDVLVVLSKNSSPLKVISNPMFVNA
jgi:hypothetical protein